MSRGALYIAGFTAVLLLVFAGAYGYHRDELYFLASGYHPALAYPDQGPLVPFLARLMNTIDRGSIWELRVPAAAAAGLIVALTALLARELGGSRRAQTIAAACAGSAAVVLVTGHLLSTATIDLLVWTAVTWLVVRAINTGDDRLWLAAGAALGIGLLNKPLPAFLALGLFAGVAIAGPRRLIRNAWVWGGAAIAVVLWLPWLYWQARHGWPQIDISRAIASGGSTSSQPRWAFLPFQLLLVGPLLAPVWIAGLVRLFRDRSVVRFRFLAWAWVVLAIVFVASGGKPYYLAGMLPVLIGAGSPKVDEWLERGRAALRVRLLGAAVVVSAAVAAVVALPVLPVRHMDPVLALNPDAGETVGWPEMAKLVGVIKDETPNASHVVVFTENYGQAAAIGRYGLNQGLPQAYSGHNGYWYWGPPPRRRDGMPVILIGFDDPAYVNRYFNDCRIATRLRSPEGIDNDENGTPIWTCRSTRRPWRELWPALRHFS
jgi:4-amino-4-deoxy-L-arabinose transferase-like glycosyltransferase